MRFVLCTLLALSSTTAFQFGSVPLRRNIHPVATTSTRRWTLKEANSQVEAESKVKAEEAEPVVDEMYVAMSNLAPSEDEEELSRDEHFMRLAIEVAEEE